ncbi:OLC1v1001861C1 [Oldenlandia corymbosa var. corymbosa]|uniref:NADH dehydrogenase [ubiquinone] 1 alpha subcomplex assembly factor 3 n=1 Tax=Oldenlandia corymbosa var. corymbosa TaxID=529605 RepID=A0AAV1D8L0_OLDCO|nr:OLC1v1001861C1 [Oldenlandia corymbosa var. corymbosa]
MAVRQRVAAKLPTLMRALKNESLTKPNINHAAGRGMGIGAAQPRLPSLRRAFSLYDQINLIDNVPEDQLRFQKFSDSGFTVNGVDYEGSLLCVGNLLMSWSPKRFSEVNAESLSLFQTMRPIPEILILGCGKHIQPVSPGLRQFIRSTGMKLEAVDSRNAISTYNILNEEGRIVAAALLPFGVED